MTKISVFTSSATFDIHHLPEKLASFNNFERTSIEFIKSWLNGQESFTIQTSGSTGTPKNIVNTRAQMLASANFTMEALQLPSNAKALVCLDTQYVAGKMMLVRALEHGLDIILKTPQSNPLLHLPHQPDFAALVPLQVEEGLNNPESAEVMNKLKALIIGGAPANHSIIERLQAMDVNAYSTYGMTETVSHIALKKLNGRNKSEYYKAFPEVKLGQDARGCLTIQSILCKNELITTNDLVRLVGDHTFEWQGRIDNVINSGGIKVQSEKVEKVIEQLFFKHNINSRFFVAGIPDSKLGHKVSLLVESTEPVIKQEDLKRHLSSFLTKYEIPKSVYYLPEFIETATGKVNRPKNVDSIIKK